MAKKVNLPIKGTLRKMEIGEKTSFPIERKNSVKSTAAMMPYFTRQSFKTRVEGNEIIVERIL